MRMVFAFLFLLLIAPIPASAGDVVVRSGDSQAQGLVRARGGSCFVVTVAHVLTNGVVTGIVDASGTSFAGELRRVFPSDLAVIEVISTDEGISPCDRQSWDPGRNLDEILSGAERGVIRHRSEGGASLLAPVDIKALTETDVIVQPSGEVFQLSQGMSGSALQVSGITAGMLMETQSGDGIVMRLDYVESLLEPYFGWTVGCEFGCQQRVARERSVAVYDYGTTQEEVYRLPSEWPIPPYLHLVTQEAGTMLRKHTTVPPLKIKRTCFFFYCWQREVSQIVTETIYEEDVTEKLLAASLSGSLSPRSVDVQLQVPSYGATLAAAGGGFKTHFSHDEEAYRLFITSWEGELHIRLSALVGSLPSSGGRNQELGLEEILESPSPGTKLAWIERERLERERGRQERRVEDLLYDVEQDLEWANARDAECEVCRTDRKCRRRSLAYICSDAAEAEAKVLVQREVLELARSRLIRLEDEVQLLTRTLLATVEAADCPSRNQGAER